jgi:phospholipid/cholesterol/gamma-HCH transport system substrate-binding protein
MTKPFKLRFVNELVGFFVLLVLIALVVGVVLAGRAQGWFEPVLTVRIGLPESGTFGLKKGAEVMLLQTPVGMVDNLKVRDDGSMEAVLKLKGDFIRFVREDSVATLKKMFTVAGDTYVEISRGRGAALPDKDARIECRADSDVIEQMRGMMDEVRAGLLAAVEKLQALMDEHTRLAAQLRDPKGDLQQFLAHLNQLAAGLEAGEGTAGKLLKDPAIANELTKLLASLNSAFDQVSVMIKKLQDTVSNFPDLATSVSAQLKNLPELILQAQVMLHEVEEVVKALQRHWLLRRYVETDEESAGRISPVTVEAGAGGAP